MSAWAKLHRDCRKGFVDSCRLACDCPVSGRLSLVAHSADVAACLLALLERPVIARRLASLLGQVELTSTDRARLAAMAALHDLGKINTGFQRAPFGLTNKKSPGHIKPLLALAEYRGLACLLADGRLEMFQHLLVPGAFIAIMAHHGHLPRILSQDAQPAIWCRSGADDPPSECRALVEAISGWFGEALLPGSLAWTEPFGHAFAGLLMLADWIGSDSNHFRIPDDGISDDARFDGARTTARSVLARRGLAPEAERATATRLMFDCKTLTTFDAPSVAQEAMLALPPALGGRICLIEDETGSGKTEAALIHFLDLFRQGEVDGLYFALPTRAAARQIHGRIEAALKRLIGPEICVTLAIPGYEPIAPADGELPDPHALLDDDGTAVDRDARWASERPKRYLASWVAVGTIDQALMGALRVRHAQLRSSLLLRSLLVVDEVHASDAYMTTILRSLLDQHRRAGGHALLMSATLGSEARRLLLLPSTPTAIGDRAKEAAAPYPAIWSDDAPSKPNRSRQPSRPEKPVQIDLEPDWHAEGAVIRHALMAARGGARVLVIRNTVNLVVATQMALEAAGAPLLQVASPGGMVLAPHHARFAPEDRSLLDAALEVVLGKEAVRDTGRIVVASQTAEQSLDIDADLLITDLCPADVLLQRIGRLHRHRRSRPPGFESARCIVLAPSEAELAATLQRDGDVKGALLGLGLIYPSLLGVVATRRSVVDFGTISIPRDNRPLVEAATHPHALEQLSDQLGGFWRARWTNERGTGGAHRTLAHRVCLKWFEPIEPLPDLDEKVTTRLGLDDRSVALPDGTYGPFGQPVSRLTLNGRWVRGSSPDTVASVTVNDAGVLLIVYAERAFVYDRQGLRPNEASATGKFAP